MSTAIAEKQNTAVSTEVLDDIFDFAGEGTSYDSSELQIPFLRIIQALSPQANKKDSQYIKGAEAGMIFNTVTGELWGGEEGIKVIPVYQTTKYLEFVPRSQGGGFKGELQPNNPDLQRTTRDGSKELLPNGNELVKSDQHYVLVLDDEGGFQPAIVDMKSTGLKVSRRWKTQIAMLKIKNPATGALVTPPLFGTIWNLTVVDESNDQGSWGNWHVERVGMVGSKELFMEAKAFRDSIERGEVKAAADPDHQGGASGGAQHDDDIPF